MKRFAKLLASIYEPYHIVSLVYPTVVVGGLPWLPSFVRKYLAYIDKLVLFPLYLFLRTRSFDLIHIADQGNAYYAFCCSPRRCIITCHDMLAIRGAYGDASVVCNPSSVGVWLQRLISAGLSRCSAVAFDSTATFNDFQSLIGSRLGQRHSVIPIPLNAPFTAEHSSTRLSAAELDILPPRPYLLMVGSSLPRKNRGLALRLLELLGHSSLYDLVFAGAPLTPDEQSFHNSHPLGSRLHSIIGPSHLLLNTLYCKAHVLLFPSFSEGFGWPLIEAQTCCCPVIASTTTSIPEVAGNGALYAEPTDVAAFASHVHALEDPGERTRLIELGLSNIRRYDAERVGEAYRHFATKQ